jgi:hypothetical protein
MKPWKTAIATALLAGLSLAAHADDPKAALDALNAKLSPLGAAHVDGSDKIADKPVPILLFGTRRINGNFDAVDAIKKSTGAAATIFVRDGEEFVRVSTNVLTPEGKRGVGTHLAHNKAYEALQKPERWCGMIDVLGTQLDSCYDPIKDASGKVVGATYVGFKK